MPKSGKGKWQVAILAELARRPAFYVNELLASGHSRAAYVALLEGMNRLESRGLIQITRYLCWGNTPGRVVICRPGYHFDRLADIQRRRAEDDNQAQQKNVCVDEVPVAHLVNKCMAPR